MAHNITIRENGQAECFVAVKPAWHELGQVTPEALTSAQAIEAALLNWQVEKVDLYAYHNGKLVLVDGKVGMQRTDNGKVLGVVGTKYQPVQNVTAFKFLDPLAREGELKYESAGSLNEGRVIWLLARMPQDTFISADDRNENYILLKSGHDGSTSMEVMQTKIRVVCQNTLNLALSNNTNRIRVKHCLNAPTKMEEARAFLMGMKAESDNLDRILKDLSIVGVASNKVTEFLDKMFPMPTVDGADGKVSTKTKNIRDQILNNFEFDAEQQTEATKGTAYGLLNAVTKYVDHQRNEKNPDARALSAMFGQGSDLKGKALSTLQSIFAIN